MVVALFMFACVGGGKPPDVASGPEATLPEAATVGVAGRYVGEPCGARTYVRNLELRADGTYEIEDRIAPCPPDAVCMWSGIVTFAGTWAETEPGVALTESPGPERPGSQPRASAYTRSAAGLEGSGCVFSRVVGGSK